MSRQPSVHVLATCLNLSLLDNTIMVFRTLRTGFPTAKVWVWGNKLGVVESASVEAACKDVGAAYTPLHTRIAHDVWIEGLLDAAKEGFWVCDTDMVFWGAVEGFAAGRMAGRLEPAFVEPWSKTHKAERLHTCLLWLDAPAIRAAVKEWLLQWHPVGFPFFPEVQLVRQTFVPQGSGKPPLFYDTCAGLWQAIGGTAFTEAQNAAFGHLHCGTYADRIERALPGIGEVHRAVWPNLEAARGLRTQQQQFYADNAIINHSDKEPTLCQ